MNKQQMIEEIQEKIADKTLSFGCNILWDWKLKWMVTKIYPEKVHEVIWNVEFKDWVCRRLQPWANYKVIWHPVSLSRVLSKLDDCYIYYKWYITTSRYSSIEENSQDLVLEEVCPRKLLKEDWSDAYLQDQSDETIQALHPLLVR